jgi:hypothetical protein
LTSDAAITPVPTTRKLIRTVHLSVETTAFTQLIDDITQSVDDLGGYMESSDISGNSISDSNGRRYAYLTVRVPSDKLDQFVIQVGEQGNVTNKSENTQDASVFGYREPQEVSHHRAGAIVGVDGTGGFRGLDHRAGEPPFRDPLPAGILRVAAAHV